MKKNVGFLLLIFFIVGAVLYYTSSSKPQDKVEYSVDTRLYVSELMVKSLIMQSAIKKYQITAEKDDLLLYKQNIILVENIFTKLLNKFDSNINQKNLIYNAKVSLDTWQNEYVQKEIRTRDKVAKSKYAISDLINIINKKEGKGYFDVFRQKLETFVNAEIVLLERRQKVYKKLLKSNDNISSKLVEENVNIVNHTNDVIIASKQLLINALDMETGMRGYLITGNNEFLYPYNSGYSNFFKQIEYLKKKVSDNPVQVTQLQVINSHMKEWSEKIVNPLLKLRKDIGDIETIDSIIKKASSHDGEKLFNMYKSKIDAFATTLNKKQ